MLPETRGGIANSLKVSWNNVTSKAFQVRESNELIIYVKKFWWDDVSTELTFGWIYSLFRAIFISSRWGVKLVQWKDTVHKRIWI